MQKKLFLTLISCGLAALLTAPASAAPVAPTIHKALEASADSAKLVERVWHRRNYRSYRYVRRHYRPYRYAYVRRGIRPFYRYSYPYYAYNDFYGPYYPYGYRYRWRPGFGIYFRF